MYCYGDIFSKAPPVDKRGKGTVVVTDKEADLTGYNDDRGYFEEQVCILESHVLDMNYIKAYVYKDIDEAFKIIVEGFGGYTIRVPKKLETIAKQYVDEKNLEVWIDEPEV